MGILAVVGYSVTNRMHEFGIRMAMGADSGRVLWAVVLRGAAMAGVGIAGGMAVSLAVISFIGSVLVDAGERDPSVFAAAFLFLAVTTLLASYLPARRVRRIDPVEVLREE